MLTQLSVHNFLVFPKLEIAFTKGLNIITGETGAGKSTILAALALLFGGRSDSGAIRKGTDRAILELQFQHQSENITELLEAHDITPDTEITIRRIIHTHKPSKCYVNGIVVTVNFLNQLASHFIQIIGQFEDRSFLNPAGFRAMLDSLIEDSAIKQNVAQSFKVMDDIAKQIDAEKDALKAALREKDYLQHVVEELSSLAPEIGEEDILTEKRSQLMHIEKNASQLISLEDGLTHPQYGIESNLLGAIKTLTALEGIFPQDLPEITTGLNQALELASNHIHKLSKFNQTLAFDPNLLNTTEERLFALRAAARKHHVSVDELAALFQEFQEKLTKIDNSAANFDALEKSYAEALDIYNKNAQILRDARLQKAPILQDKITQGLADLNMKHATFCVRLEGAHPSQNGSDKVIFQLATSKGMAFGELHKTASGGELSRFMLSAKSAITDHYTSLIFDEIDRGVGGATAEAVGLKLRDLSQKIGQLIVITHSPQVAAKGDSHFHIEKHITETETFSQINTLMGQARHNEIARMLSGATITNEALAAAEQLLV